jgi:hypothetical protein
MKKPAPAAEHRTPEITSAAEARALCAAVKSAAGVLSDLIDSETALIAGGRAHEIERHQGDKAELSAAYLAQMTKLKRNADAVRDFAPEEIESLRPLLQELGAKLLRNQDALAAILAISERLIRAAALKAVAADSGPGVYGIGGDVATPPPANPATTFDRQL